MHLSPLSEGFLSDHFDDAGSLDDETIVTTGRAHRDGLLRGLALLAVVAVLVGLGFVSSAIHASEADPAPYADEFIHCAVATR